jgi:protein tyrosine/serine phosphatase
MIRQTKRLTRPYVRVVQGSYRAMRHAISARSPARFRGGIDSALDYVDLLMVDHGVFRAIYSNTHSLSHQVWRSSQPAPSMIRRLAKRRGLKTVINLRGDRDCGSYRLEKAACDRYGITLIDFIVKSREAPEPHVFHDAKALFDSIEYPMLLHCKSGADRAGLMSALFMILKAGLPVEEARRQLSLRYGHIKQADTGVLDMVFESYLAHSSREPIAFLDWIDRHYDAWAISRTFRARGWANVFVNRLIKRE